MIVMRKNYPYTMEFLGSMPLKRGMERFFGITQKLTKAIQRKRNRTICIVLHLYLCGVRVALSSPMTIIVTKDNLNFDTIFCVAWHWVASSPHMNIPGLTIQMRPEVLKPVSINPRVQNGGAHGRPQDFLQGGQIPLLLPLPPLQKRGSGVSPTEICWK